MSWLGGEEEKISFLELSVPPAARGRLTMALELDDDGRNVGIEDAELIACLVTEPWKQASPMAWDDQPARECDQAVPAVYQPEIQEFFFDLSALLPTLASDSMHGLALVPDPETQAPAFQVVFRSALKGGARLEYLDASSGGAQSGSEALPPDALAPDAAPSSLPQLSMPLPRIEGPDAEMRERTTALAAGERPTGEVASPFESTRRATLESMYLGMFALAILLALGRVAPPLATMIAAGSRPEAIRRGPSSRRRR